MDLRLSVTVHIPLEYIVPQMANVVESVVLGRQQCAHSIRALSKLVRRVRRQHLSKHDDERDVTKDTVLSRDKASNVRTRCNSIVCTLRSMNDEVCALANEYVKCVVREWTEYLYTLHKAVVEKTRKLNVECTRTEAMYAANQITQAAYDRTLDEIMNELRVFIDERVQLRVRRPVIVRSDEFVKSCDALSARYAASYGHVPTSTLVSLKNELDLRIAFTQQQSFERFVHAICEIVGVPHRLLLSNR